MAAAKAVAASSFRPSRMAFQPTRAASLAGVPERPWAHVLDTMPGAIESARNSVRSGAPKRGILTVDMVVHGAAFAAGTKRRSRLPGSRARRLGAGGAAVRQRLDSQVVVHVAHALDTVRD